MCSVKGYAPNPYQASVVKRADGGIAGAGWPSAKQREKRRDKYLRLT
jgi:hypothetical protein